MILLYIAAIAVLLCGSAFFSSSEMAVTSANRLRLESMAEDGSRSAAAAVKMLDRYDRTLSAILIGNNLCNIASDSLLTVVLMTLLGSRYNAAASVISTLLMTLFVILFCESLPKLTAKRNANRRSMSSAGFLSFLSLILTPVIWLVTLLVRLLTFPFKGEKHEETEEEATAELQSILETVEDEGVIDEDRSEMLRSALDFSEIPVMDVMTARVDVQALDVNDDWHEQLLDKEDCYTRIPVYDGSIDNIIGVLHVNRFFRTLLSHPDADMRRYLMKPLYMYKTVKLPDALTQFRREQQHLAVVTDEYGGTLGVVTIEDILEHLVGEIWDETDDVETDVVERPEGRFEVDGGLPIAELADLLDRDEESLDTESATAGGWAIEKKGSFPAAGDVIESDGLRARVLAMSEDGLRVERLLFEKISPEKE